MAFVQWLLIPNVIWSNHVIALRAQLPRLRGFTGATCRKSLWRGAGRQEGLTYPHTHNLESNDS